jgi:hypothetical protein
MSILIIFYIVVLGPSLWFLFRLFKSRSSASGEEQ